MATSIYNQLDDVLGRIKNALRGIPDPPEGASWNRIRVFLIQVDKELAGIQKEADGAVREYVESARNLLQDAVNRYEAEGVEEWEYPKELLERMIEAVEEAKRQKYKSEHPELFQPLFRRLD